MKGLNPSEEQLSLSRNQKHPALSIPIHTRDSIHCKVVVHSVKASRLGDWKETNSFYKHPVYIENAIQD